MSTSADPESPVNASASASADTAQACASLGRGLHALWSPEPGALWSAQAGQAEDPWDLIIVGTGYGGSMAAAVLAGCTVSDGQGGRRPVRLCILERGKEFRPGGFPSRLAELPGQVRIAQQSTGEVGGQAEGLFDLRGGDDVVALVANGVGGGSLINAGVLLEPEADELRNDHFRDQVQALKDGGWYPRARAALGAARPGPAGEQLNTIARHPAHAAQPLAKVRALQALAGRHASTQAVPLTVAMTAGPNAAGVTLPACTLCGDCMTGCNVGAKDSLDVNLLRQAVDAGVRLFTGASVGAVLAWEAEGGQKHRGAAAASRTGGRVPALQESHPSSPRWVVEVAHTRPDLQAREAGPLRLHARHVILAAGTLGSTEILLRSRNAGLALSQRLGERFSCNGDNIAAVHRLPQATEGCADENTALDARRVGPPITTALRFEALPQQGSRPFWLQEFSVPGALRRLFEEIVTTGHAVHQLPQADLARHGPASDPGTDPAAVDHLPHLIAFTICSTADDLAQETREAVLKFAASGFRDFTRIASSDVDMWRDVFLNNREAVLEMLARFTEDSQALGRAIRWGERDFIEDRIRRGRKIRRSLIERKQA